MLELSHINKELLYKVLATPSFSEKELWLQEFLMEYASQKDYECSIDETSIWPKANCQMDAFTLVLLPTWTLFKTLRSSLLTKMSTFR